jgi:uncharacterized cupin superfamily protein
MDEAEIVTTEHGDVPRGEGWYVLNAQRAQWQHSPGFGGSDLSFQGDLRFPEVGFHVGVLQPGEPACMYHREDTQEGFLVLSGRCLAIVEGTERLLEPWDYLHCPGGTEHVLVGAGDGPCVVFMAGAREHRGSAVYTRDETALKHGAGVETETPHAKEAYAPYPKWRKGPPETMPL